MSIIKYFNEAYNNYLSSISVSVVINNFIDNCMRFINKTKIKYYTLSYTPYINARQLQFNKNTVGYFLVNKTDEFTTEEEDNYNLFLNYLSLLLYNTKNYNCDIDNNLYVEILNTTNLNLVITDNEFNIYYYNQNFISFISVINPYTQKMIDILKTKTLQDIFPHLTSIIKANEIYKNKKININFIKNNKTIILELNVNSLQYLERFYNIITIDEKNNKKIIDNTSFLSHELRNPLQTIILATSIIKKNISKEDKYLNMILKASEDMKKIINDILDLNKINNNELILTIEQININNFMNDIFILLKSTININTNIEFKLIINNDVPEILFTDITRLKQIIINLLSNAIKYSKKNQKNLIKIHIKIQDDLIYFEIQDEGIGIKQEDLEQLKNFNLDILINSNDSHGLGLFICNKLARLLGGTLNITSEYEKGSTFIFTHPIKVGISHNLDDSNLFFDDLDGIEKNILIVDDIEANVLLLKMIIHNFNNQYLSKFNVDIAMSGENCIILSKDKNYDIIFLDLTMQFMDGYCTAKILRKNNFSGKIIIMTGDDKIKSSTLIDLFDGILIKPFDNNSLLEIIKKYLN
jgi:signal transduction histidine kinase